MVDDRQQPERFEVPLTPTTDRRAPEPVDTPTPPPDAPDAEPPDPETVLRADPIAPRTGWWGSERSRLVTVAAVAGVVALLLGWMLGRAGGVGEGEVAPVASAPAATDPPTTPPTVLSGVTLPPPEVESASSTPPIVGRRTTTTVVAELEVEQIAVDERLADVPIVLVGGQQGRFVVELDVVDGTLTRRDPGLAGAAMVAFGDFGIVAGDGWIVIPDGNAGREAVLWDDGTVTRAELGEPWEMTWIAGTDRFWRRSGSSPFGGSVTFEPVDVTGAVLPGEITVPRAGWPTIADPLGGLITTVSGRVYQVTRGGSNALAVGDLIAVSAERAVVRECGDDLRCRLITIDRTTGAAQELPAHESLGDATVEGQYNFGPQIGQQISPDGSLVAVVVLTQSAAKQGLVDLDTGELTTLGEGFGGPSGVVWSTDGRFVFYLDRGVPFAFETATGEAFPVADGLLTWSSLTARPPSG